MNTPSALPQRRSPWKVVALICVILFILILAAAGTALWWWLRPTQTTALEPDEQVHPEQHLTVAE